MKSNSGLLSAELIQVQLNPNCYYLGPHSLHLPSSGEIPWSSSKPCKDCTSSLSFLYSWNEATTRNVSCPSLTANKLMSIWHALLGTAFRAACMSPTAEWLTNLHAFIQRIKFSAFFSLVFLVLLLGLLNQGHSLRLCQRVACLFKHTAVYKLPIALQWNK